MNGAKPQSGVACSLYAFMLVCVYALAMRVRLVKTFTFEAAHFLPSFPEGHKCRRMHGHSFKVDVVVEGDIPAGQHCLIDYGDIKAVIDPIYDQIDHRCLNEIKGLENPTSEMIANWLWDRLRPKLNMLAEIVVYETCTSRCEFRGGTI
jgi:6-pyruvoyltetrahydropterin/6-carboxytetrahydropterin synthase